MRELFIVGIKLYGVVSLYSVISQAFILIQMFQTGPMPGSVVFPWLIGAAVSALAVYFSIFQAELLADIFGLGKGSAHLEGFSRKAALKTGFILLGVHRLLYAVPAALKELASMADSQIPNSPYSNVQALIGIALPLALVFAADKLIELIERGQVKA